MTIHGPVVIAHGDAYAEGVSAVYRRAYMIGCAETELLLSAEFESLRRAKYHAPSRGLWALAQGFRAIAGYGG